MKPQLHLSAIIPVLAAFLFTAAAVADDDYTVLHGTWKCDVEKTTKILKENGVDESTVEMILDEVSSFVVTVGKDGKMSVDAGEMKMSGTWKGKKIDKEKKSGTFAFTESDGQETVVNFKMIDKNTAQMAPEGESFIVFKRVTKEKKDKSADDKKDQQPIQYVNYIVQEDDDKEKEAAAKKLIGTWQGDKELCEKLFDEMEEEVDASMREMMLSMVAGIKVTFSADKNFNVEINTPQGNQEVKGTWSVKSYDKEKQVLTVHTEPAEGSVGTADDLNVHFRKDGKIEIGSDDEPPMGLKKVKATEKKDDK